MEGMSVRLRDVVIDVIDVGYIAWRKLFTILEGVMVI